MRHKYHLWPQAKTYYYNDNDLVRIVCSHILWNYEYSFYILEENSYVVFRSLCVLYGRMLAIPSHENVKTMWSRHPATPSQHQQHQAGKEKTARQPAGEENDGCQNWVLIGCACTHTAVGQSGGCRNALTKSLYSFAPYYRQTGLHTTLSSLIPTSKSVPATWLQYYCMNIRTYCVGYQV